LSVFHYNFIYAHVYLLFPDFVPLGSTYNDDMHNICANITGKHIYDFYVSQSYGITYSEFKCYFLPVRTYNKTPH